jgi:hypothetical protein
VSQSLDAHDTSIIAATATLAYFQGRCGKRKPPAGYTDISCATKVKELTRLSRGLLRFPGETIAISADIFQNSIRLTVAHASGNLPQSQLGKEEREQREK